MVELDGFKVFFQLGDLAIVEYELKISLAMEPGHGPNAAFQQFNLQTNFAFHVFNPAIMIVSIQYAYSDACCVL